MNIVISQPMYFPWVGMFEQIRQSDIFIYYDDVQFSKGSFTNRVQIKTDTKEGFGWLTVPLKNLNLGQNINEVEIDNQKNWKNQHIELLKQAYKNSPHKIEMLALVKQLFDNEYQTIATLSTESMNLVIDYFDLAKDKQFFISSQLDIGGSSSQRVFELVKYFKGTKYITGHGAKNYLDHQLFDNNNIQVHYMNYMRMAYPQLHGVFNPHITILDLIANVGKAGLQYIISSTKYWKSFIPELERTI
jgi:stalled ribosome rescue protein Dom34